MRVNRILVASALLCVSSAIPAQLMSVERTKVLGLIGKVEVTDNLVTPAKQGPGTVFTRPMRHDGATSIRLRFTVLEGGDLENWTVAVIGSDSRRWEHKPGPGKEPVFWSDEMPGDNATVELVSTVAQPAVKLVIDRTAGTTPPTAPKSITDPDEREAWSRQREPVLTLGRSVVRLRFVDDEEKKIFVCTGWIAFDNRHLLTNQHCINSQQEALSALVDLDYDTPSTVPASARLRKVVTSDARLDFSLLELEQPLDREPLRMGDGVTGGQRLIVIEHPAGEPKQVSRRGCAVGQVSVPGTTDDLTDFEHLCDTLGGSSGSPVLDFESHAVIGLHHLGFLAGDKPVNRAVRIDKVNAAIRSAVPGLGQAGGSN